MAASLWLVAFGLVPAWGGENEGAAAPVVAPAAAPAVAPAAVPANADADAPALSVVPQPQRKAGSGGWNWKKDIEYYPEADREKGDDYLRSQCRLDLMLPKDATGFDTVVWFHGGGLTGGRRGCPSALGDKNTAVVGVGYRLYSKKDIERSTETADPIKDAAAAVAWVLEHIAEYGGDPARVFVAGHSAGGYLSAMVGLDPRYLAAHGRKPTELAGVMPISGQMTTHFQISKNRDDKRPFVVDEFAPIYHARADAPPFLLICGDPKIEWPARVEENAMLAATLRRLKHKDVTFYSLPGFNHGQVAAPGYTLCRQFMNKSKKK